MKLNVLDSGYVRFVEDWGRGDAGLAEAGIIEAARQSTHSSFRGWENDAKLLAYLYNHKHDSPFEFAGMVLEVKAPIFVFREWHRHRTQAYNEMSARYTAMPNEGYLPDIMRLSLKGRDDKNVQSLGSKLSLSIDEAQDAQDLIRCTYTVIEGAYQKLLELGVPKKIARVVIPVGRYSQMRASTSLRCWLMFLTLRIESNTQWETRQYANAVGDIIAERFPQTWELFKKA